MTLKCQGELVQRIINQQQIKEGAAAVQKCEAFQTKAGIKRIFFAHIRKPSKIAFCINDRHFKQVAAVVF